MLKSALQVLSVEPLDYVEEQRIYDGEEQHVLLDVNWCTVDEQLEVILILLEVLSTT